MGLFCLGAPRLSPLNRKALSLPIVNPVSSMAGRVFFFSWLGFMLSFMAWYAFPPLLGKTIKADLKLTTVQVLNSNIVALAAGMCMRLITGPLCDLYGPRYVMVGILFVSAIPCGLAGTITSVTGLYLIRFFVGIAGAAFVPCQVWCTGFFDKNVVGTSNAFAAGWGNAGAGVTYFVMPAVFDSLVHMRGYTPHVAWRISFIVPTILLIACGLGVLFLCDDTPTGSWATRDRDLHALANGQLDGDALHAKLGDVSKTSSKNGSTVKAEVNEVKETGTPADMEPVTPYIEIVERPSLRSLLPAVFCLQTLMLAAPYFCTFGGELAINSILSSYYLQHAPKWGQTKAGQWAAMFGLLNVVTRPAGGYFSDKIYQFIGPKRGVNFKKFWYGFLCFMQGVFCLWVGLVNPKSMTTLVGGIAGVAIFMDAANGAAYGLLPHVNPHVNGLMSGTVGASGNLGGIIFSVIFRFTAHPSYAKGIWIIGVISMAIGAGIMAIPPIPAAQRRAGGYMST